MSEDPTQDLTAVDLLRLVLADVRDIKARVTALESIVDDRLKDTRPIWQAINERTERMEARLEAVEARLDSVERELRSVNRQFETFSIDHMRMRADIRDFGDRVTELERRPN